MARTLRLLPVALALLVAAATVGWMERKRLRRRDTSRVRVVRIVGVARAGERLLATGSVIDPGQPITVTSGRLFLALPRGEVVLSGEGALDLLGQGNELWLRQGRLAVDGQARQPIAIYTRGATVAVVGGRGEVVAGERGTTVRVARARIHVEAAHRTSLDLAAGQRVDLPGEGAGPRPSSPPVAPIADPTIAGELATEWGE